MPEGWTIRKLGEVLDVQNGFAFDSDQFADHEGMPLIRIRDLKNGCTTSLRFAGEYDERFLVNSGDLLIGMDGEFRCYIWRGGPALLNQRVCRLIGFSEEIDPEFIALGIDSHLKQIEDATPYVTVKHLSAKAIKAIDFAYPDLAEQRRIVAHIKECLERLDEVESLRLEGVQEAQSLEFACFHDEVETGIKERAWAVRELGDVALSFKYGTSDKAHAEPIGVPVLRMGNLQAGHLDTRDLKYIELEAADLKRYRLSPGDVLINRTNSLELVGKAATFSVPDGDWVYASYLVRVEVDRRTVLPEFVTAVINSRMGRDYVARTARRAIGMVNLNAKEMAKFPMPVPTLDEQREVVEKLRLARQAAEELRSLMTDPGLSTLRQAVLRKAFAGDL
jgi:type I restriction enzyme S subunit